MNPKTLSLIAKAFSMKKELRIITAVFLGILLIPIFAVVILTQAGIDLVSGSLAGRNLQNTHVEIRNPANGEVVDEVNTTATWPVGGVVTLEFGVPHLPVQLFHTGIDIADPQGQVGDPVVAFMEGTVIYADTLDWGFGRHVKVDNGHHVTSIYAHLDTLSVKVGDKVQVGTVLGTEGNTGWSTGPHLHFQINVFGIPVNPRIFLDGNP